MAKKAAPDAKNNGGLVAIVTGLEHSGTTLMGRFNEMYEYYVITLIYSTT